MPAGGQGYETRKGQCRRLRGHMPTVRDKRHGTENGTADDFTNHHYRGEEHNQPGAPRVMVVTVPQKCVGVLPWGCGMGVHGHLVKPLRYARVKQIRRPLKRPASAMAYLHSQIRFGSDSEVAACPH